MVKKSIMSLIMVLLIFAGFSTTITSVDAAEGTTITILHTNDSHGRVHEGKYDGMGFAKLATFAKQEMAENPNTLLLDAGDTMHGTPFATLEKGSSIVQIMNTLGYDAMAAGNHDFNYGYERTLELAVEADFPILSANVRKPNDDLLLPSDMIQEIDGVKVGVFGLSTPETYYKTHPDNIEGLAFTDPVEEAKVMVEKLKGEGADVIIALTHLGTDASSTETSIKVAEGAPGIDLIVDGHSHTVDNISKNGESTLIVSAGEYTKNLGVVELQFDAENKLISKTADRYTKEDAADIEEDPETKAVIDEIQERQDAIMSEVIGQSAVELNGERADVRTSETNLGNMITDAMIATSGADLAITNGGGIRASIGKGDVTLGDVIEVSPFGNYLITKKMSGATVKAALEHGVSDYPNTKGAFPQVSGLSFTLDSKAGAGDRVQDLMIQGEPVDLEKIYTVATNDFLAAGGDDYMMFKDTELVNEYGALEEIMKEYFKNNSPVEIGDEDRINVYVPFTDVNSDHWAYDHIERLYGHNVFFGVSADEFGITQPLTRVQFASLLVRGLGLEATETAPFSDLEEASETMQEEISAAYEHGLVAGHTDGTFKPHQAIKRYEMALMIKNAYELQVSEPVADNKEMKFEDIGSVNEAGLVAIELVHELGFMVGHNETTFEPFGDTKREQGAIVIDLYLHAVQ